ncbi:MAG: RNA-binding domain-containing protein [Candidatus Acidiferrales bacterium]
MAQLGDQEILERIVRGDVLLRDGLVALLNRNLGHFAADEGQLLDYKRTINAGQQSSIAELARDILGFSNTNGGLLIVGVDNDKVAVGHEPVDFRALRDALGPFIGTRVDFDLEECPVTIEGQRHRLLGVITRRSQTAYPNQLRKDIELRPGIIRKIKYVRGTLFYRENNETRAESPDGDVESRARSLGFSGAAPRTRTSFLLQEDKPNLRLYAPINDRFFGRAAELAELISKFEDPRGRGVSIAGFGGVGKTELAIRLVSELHRRGKFLTIYSGSAKQTLLGPGGAQQTDPVFMDLPTFLNDLAGWLGFNPPRLSILELKASCLTELAKLKRVLLLVDNLETVSDRSLVAFLDNELPANCWLVATSRVHKIRNFVFSKELREMLADDAAHLLRHELKRQGLADRASTPIEELRTKAKQLFCHPLAIRWFAWACRRDARTWDAGIGTADVRELETFCVAHTLNSIDTQTRRLLGAIFAIQNVTDATEGCIHHTSGLPESAIERGLWELECSGMIYGITDEDGMTTYSVAPMVERPVSDLARKNGWEGAYVQNLRSYVRQQRDVPDSPLVGTLLKLDPRRIRDYSREEKLELTSRVDRALQRCPEKYSLKLKQLKAECLRHLDSLVSADDLYRDCAEAVLAEGTTAKLDLDKIRILLEAATVAKVRALTPSQLQRAIRYLQAIQETDAYPLRVFGMLTEMYALLGDQAKHDEYRRRAKEYCQLHPDLPDHYVGSLEEAIARAKAHLEKHS